MMSFIQYLFPRWEVTYVLLAVLSVPSQAFAWGGVGHQVVATLAEEQLSPKARAQIEVLLAQEAGSSLASISTWADEHKNPATARWHYLNFPRDSCIYDRTRDCPGDSCLVEATARQLQVLKSEATNGQKLLALKYVVHLVGDLHQPLHLGYLDDKGGNLFQIQAYKKGSNLHSLWDSGLIKYISDDPGVWAAKLSSLPVLARSNVLDPARVAEESCRIVTTPGFYPERKVEGEYVGRWTPVVEQQLQLAGARLAKLLNDAFR